MDQETNDELVATLTDQLSAAYTAAQANNDQAMQKLLLKNATDLNNDQPYLDVITNLTHDISKYYIHNHQVPESVMAIYHELQADVKRGKIDADEMRKRNIAVGIVMSPIMFGGIGGC
ncbi:bacteriocin immunity protein [Lactiplantibacillus sp. WILCCON 0030]|uniref:Bacteriocin immunity protein n=1 Tax=Lactiplantibacillus brownii TaxID=3069269 RepID=A0ABU1AC92_9LACO|nr:bacteriocin immunity protein [Lactiplantibacillus brownii]MDQ7938594.1 bacteriocin immunity protein [Lactiplantibacillus brownii]